MISKQREAFEIIINDELDYRVSIMQQDNTWIEWNSLRWQVINGGAIFNSFQQKTLSFLWDQFYATYREEIDDLSSLSRLLPQGRKSQKEHFSTAITAHNKPSAIELEIATYMLKQHPGAVINQYIMVIDTEMDEGLKIKNKSLSINWLVFMEPFNFDEVEICNASDQVVEHFCMKIGNHLGEQQYYDYQQVKCRLRCNLTTNTIRILQSFFAEVTT